jgi:hypothetical protein
VRAASLVLLLLVLACFPAAAEESVVSSWFRTEAKARAYLAIEQQLVATFDAARAADLPLAILVEKLREGAAKGVRPDRLAAGLQEEARRLLEAKEILLARKAAIDDPAVREETLKAMSIALLAGLSPETVGEFFSLAAPPRRGPRDAVAALAGVIPVRDATRLADTDIRRLGAALLASRLPAPAFKSVAAFFLRASASGAREQDILEGMVIPSLQAGGGLVQMEDALRVFLRRRDSR